MKKFFYNLEFDYINSYGTKEYLDLGVFSTPKKAKDKIANSMKLPGFDKYTLDNYKIIKFGVNVPSKDFKKENIKLYNVWHEYYVESEDAYYWSIFDYFITKKEARKQIEYLKKHSRLGKKYPNNFDIDVTIVDYDMYFGFGI